MITTARLLWAAQNLISTARLLWASQSMTLFWNQGLVHLICPRKHDSTKCEEMFIILYFHFFQKKICQSTSGSGVQHNTLLLCFSLVTTEISLKRTAQGNVHLNWSYRIEKLTLCCALGVEGSVTAEAETVERMYEWELVCFLLCCVLVGSYGNGAW